MSTVNQFKSVTDGLDSIRRRVEEAIRHGRSQECMRYVRQLNQQFKKDRRILVRTEQGMQYAAHVERYLHELEPRVNDVFLHAEVVAYVTTGSNLLKRLNGARRTNHSDAERRYRTQLEKLISTFDNRIAAAPYPRIDDFLRGCQSVEPPLRGVAERAQSRAQSVSRMGGGNGYHDFERGSASPFPTASPGARAGGAKSAAPFFPGIAQSSSPSPAKKKPVADDWTASSFLGEGKERNFEVFHRELAAFGARKKFYTDLRDGLLSEITNLPFGGDKDFVNDVISSIDEAIEDAEDETAGAKENGAKKSDKKKPAGDQAAIDQQTISLLQSQLKKAQKEVAQLQQRLDATATTRGSTSTLGTPDPSKRAPSRAASRGGANMTADDIEAYFQEHPMLLTKIAMEAFRSEGIQVQDETSLEDKSMNKRITIDKLGEEGYVKELGVEQDRLQKWQLAAMMVARKQERQHSVVLRLAQTVYADISTDQVIRNIMESARDLLQADRCAIFLVDQAKQELYSTLAHVDGITGDEVRFPMSAGIAGHVASTGETLIVDDAYAEPRFNQDVDKSTGYHTRTILCMPIRAVNGEIVGVAQVVNKHGEKLFTEEDAELFEEFAVYCGISLCNAQLYEQARGAKRKTQKALQKTEKLARKLEMVLQFAKLVYQGLETVSLVPQIMQLGRELVDADRCALFLLDADTNELYSHVAEGVEEIRFSSKQGIAGFVATSGQTLNIGDAYEDNRFNRDIDKATGYRTKSLLCVPVKNGDGEVIAVCQLVNKKSGQFTSDDEEIFVAFAVFCGIALFNARLYDVAILSQKKTQVALELISYHSVASGYEVDKLTQSKPLRKELSSALPSYNFSLHKLSGDLQAQVIIESITRSGLVEHFHVPRDPLIRLVLTLRKNYRRVPYHNFSHAATVTQSMFSYLKLTKRAQMFSPLEQFAMLIACVCHDVDHRGTNNQFQVESNSPLAQIYNGTSVMENHHWDRSVTILSSPEHNIFTGFSSADISKFWVLLKARILDTDLALYFKKRGAFEALVKEKTFDEKKPDHREMAAAMFMTCCDISTITKPFMQCRYWAEIVSSEFYAQGDVEKAMGKTPQKMFDRDVSKLPEMQVGFIKFVGRPLYAMMADFDSAISPQLSQLDANCARWQALDAGEAKENDTTYEEEELERIVVDEAGIQFCEKPLPEDQPGLSEGRGQDSSGQLPGMSPVASPGPGPLITRFDSAKSLKKEGSAKQVAKQSPKASPKTSPKQSPKASPKASPKGKASDAGDSESEAGDKSSSGSDAEDSMSEGESESGSA